nr:reverse transcriptase domain-containing protein [Tanacetum cinerariifolium]
MDKEPMWAANHVVALTSGSVITIPETVNEFAIKGNHLTLVKGNQFDGRTKTDPHKHIHEFLKICDMFKYRDTENEVARLMMFPLSLTGEAKTWLDELNEGTIITWNELQTAFISQLFPPALFDRLLREIQAFSEHENESLTDAWLCMKEMLQNCHGHNMYKGNIIKIFYHGLSEITQEVLNPAASGIFLYKTPNQAYQLLKDKVLLKLDCAKNQKTKPSLKKTITFSDEELQSNAKKAKPDLDEDDIPMSREEESKFMQTFRKTHFYNDYHDRDSNRDKWRSNNRNSYNRDNYRSNANDKSYDLQKQFNDFMKSQQSTNAFVEETFMDLKTQLETVAKNHQALIQNLETRFDRLADKQSGRPSGIAENMLVEVCKFTFPVDFVILEMEEDSKKQLNLGIGTERMIFNIDSSMKHSYSNDDTCFSIDVIDEILEEDFNVLLDKEKKNKLISVLKKHKQAFSWKTTDIPGIFPSFYKHKIQLLDDKKPVVQKQRRLNLNMQEVVKKEIVKLLDTGIIYLIDDSPWVSPIYCVPKKGGITVITNKNDELVPTRTVTGWRVCIDYRKLNEAIAKDHFPLPFMDQMLERLAGNKCMLAIFHDMIEESVEVFMEDFSVFGIVLGHKVSSAGLEVDKAKIGVILKLPPPANMKAGDYVYKWAEAQSLPTYDAQVVITFLKKLFFHFRMLKALISDRGTYFCNKNANPFVPIPPNGLYAKITQELNELRALSAMIDSHLKIFDHTMLPNEININDLEFEDELIDTPLVSPFLVLDGESNDGKVLKIIVRDMIDVVMGRPFRAVTQLEYDCVKGLISFSRIFELCIYRIPRTIPRLKNFDWSKVPPILELSQWDLMSGLKYSHEKNKFMYKN